MTDHAKNIGYRLDLWVACALPGDGPEFQFTATPPRKAPRIVRWLRSLRKDAR